MNNTPPFRSFELSNPKFETSGLKFITVKSKNLKGRADIVLYVPSTITNHKNVPIIILLHGVYGSAWAWTMSGGVHLTTHKMILEKSIPAFIIAMPSDGLWGDGSGYLPHDNIDFEKWIVEDVPAALKQAIPENTNNSAFFIAGLSMGGFGAIRIGAKYPSIFRAISGHSSITNINQFPLFVEESIYNYQQAGKEVESLFETIQSNKNNLPPLRFDCGKKDLLIEENRILHTALTACKIDHVYEEFEGEHNWEYWQEHIKQTLIFFSKQL